MKLYYSPHVCSLAPHIVLRELGTPFELVKVDFQTKTMADGRTLDAITPKSYVPVLELPDGNLLTELAVILRYLGDLRPEAHLAPPATPGSIERLRYEELLHFIATELHKGFAPYTLIPHVGDEAKAWVTVRLASRVEILRTQLGGRSFIFGERFTAADAYAFWALRAFGFLTKTKLEGTLKEYMARMTVYPSVKESVDVEKRA